MGKRIAKVLDIDGQFRENPDFPVAVVRERHGSETDTASEGTIVDPVFSSAVERNLYGRLMTLLEATTEQHKLKAVKDLFGKELREWSTEVYTSAKELAEGGQSYNNIYTRQ